MSFDRAIQNHLDHRQGRELNWVLFVSEVSLECGEILTVILDGSLLVEYVSLLREDVLLAHRITAVILDVLLVYWHMICIFDSSLEVLPSDQEGDADLSLGEGIWVPLLVKQVEL